MPAVTEPSSPSGLPMARTASPTLSLSLSPSVALVSPETFSARTTARSVAGSVPTMVAVALLPSLNFTWTLASCPTPATTWLLVRIRPSADSTTPEPSA